MANFEIDTTPSRAKILPDRKIVTDVTVSENAVVTTSEDHNYVDGSIVRLYVRDPNPMIVNGLSSKITVLSDTTFRTEIDTRTLSSFVSPSFPSELFTQAQVIPVNGVFFNDATPLS